ncbi:MAG: exodeoxyribonuclease III [Limibacillus sp.]
MVKIATWNVNSINARLPNAEAWLKAAEPDVVLLQEIKCESDKFPALAFEALGYKALAHGQKSYNGVASLSKEAIEDVQEGLPGGSDDSQARYLEATTFGLRVASIYLPNGNPAPGEKYDYKLAWMKRLKAQAESLLKSEQLVVLGGDYNCIPQPEDCHDPKAWADDALFLPQTRQAFREILNLGYAEAFRELHPSKIDYSFWDYQRGAWQQDKGIRIDHLLLSPQATDRLVACEIDRGPRGEEKASDHTPVWCELEL